MRSHAPLTLAAVAVAFTLVLVGCTAEERPPTAGIAGATHSSSPASNGTTTDLDATIQQRDFAIKYVLDGITQAGEEVPVPTPRGLLWESRLPEGAVEEGDLAGHARCRRLVRRRCHGAGATAHRRVRHCDNRL